MKTNKKGFTLIELLIVIAIIAILAAVIIANTSSARIRARDARRLQDLDQIALAAAMYYSKNGSYPANIAAMVTSGDLSAAPTDPGTGSYTYGTCLNASGSPIVVVAATLEADAATAAKDGDPTTPICGVSCNASMVYCLIR